MDLKHKLVDMTREGTGDPRITLTGDFRPRGLTWKSAADSRAVIKHEV